jgi:riboflavin kinase/FMN adenylyltransferase
VHVLRSIPALAELPGPVFLAIGVFDGVHLGHQAVIGRAREDAERAGGTAVVVTFDPHPMRVLRPEQGPRLLTSTPHKIRLLRGLGIEHLLILPFDRTFAATPPEEFIRALAEACRPLREICVGHAWSFGRGRAGNLQMLNELGQTLGFAEVGVPAVEIDGQIVSSTSIRQAVQAGELARAAQLLGREYTVLGTVVAGQQLGRQLGYPTANLRAHNEQFPPDGVYAVEALWQHRIYPGVGNIGVRPTVREAGGERLFEIHLFDFHEDLYGEEIEARFRGFLRGEQKFAGVEELQAQIGRDSARARAVLGQSG